MIGKIKNMLKQSKNQKLFIILFCIFVSFIVLTLTSNSSFLYPFNRWTDDNLFFTTGKSMMKGRVPYLDVFEQKGILVHFIYGLAYLISNTSFIGVYIFEIIAMSVGLYYVHKCISLFLDKKWTFILVPIYTTLICISNAFTYGGSVEEFCLPLMIITLYFFLDFYKNNNITYKRLFIAGLCAGCVLISKYTLLGFWFAFMACIFFSLVAKKEYKRSIISCIIFLMGMAIPFVIVLIYMGINHGIEEFFNVYFVINMTQYGATGIGIVERIKTMISTFIDAVKNSGILPMIFMILMPIALLKFNLSKKGKISLIVLYCFTILGVYWGLKGFPYYLMPVQTCMLITLISIATIIDTNVKFNNKTVIIISIITIVLSTITAYFGTVYQDNRFMKKEDTFQYKFAKIINKEKNPTLINIGGIDCGVFTAANVVPSTYYFSQFNFDERYTENVDELRRYIREKKTMFVVYFTVMNEKQVKESEKDLFDKYDLISSGTQKSKGVLYRAYLFKVKKNS